MSTRKENDNIFKNRYFKIIVHIFSMLEYKNTPSDFWVKRDVDYEPRYVVYPKGFSSRGM